MPVDAVDDDLPEERARHNFRRPVVKRASQLRRSVVRHAPILRAAPCKSPQYPEDSSTLRATGQGETSHMTLAEEAVAKETEDQRPDEQASQPDGAVEDAADDAATGMDAEVQVDLGTMEALLFSAHHPLTAGRLGELLGLQSTKPVRRAIKDLNQTYTDTGRSFRVEQVAGGYQLLTLPEYGEALQKMHQREADTKLTKSALETLAIVAYKQPILRADVEAIRGVACGETIRSLMEKHLVKIAGRAELPGRPILYGTTKRFLELFGLNSVKDLPQPEALQQKAANS
jgi:segregation and condensation protein B